MNVKKQQMQLQLQPQRRHNRTGFETLLDRTAADETAVSPPPGASWSPVDAGRYRHHHRHHDHQLPGPDTENDAPSANPSDGRRSPFTVPAVTTPPPPSPLSLPSPYYDRNPIIGFPLHQHHHAPKSPTVTTAAAAVPLANVQNVVRAGADQDPHNDHYANNNSKVSLYDYVINALRGRHTYDF